MKNFYFIIAKEKVYSYFISLVTIVFLFLMSVQLKTNLNKSESVSTNLTNTQNELVSNDNEYNMYK